MNREDKGALINELHGLFAGVESVVLADTSGVGVNALATLRRRCRKEGVTFRIAKNTLARRALDGTEVAGVADKVVGPTAFAFKAGDPVTPAKLIVEYAKENPKFAIKGGYISGSVLDPAGVENLSKSKGRDELRADLLSLFVAPQTQLLGVFSTMCSQVLGVMQARADELEKQGQAA